MYSYMIRNKRDSRFFPGNKPAGILGITKKLLFFIENHVNGVGFQVIKALDCKFGVLRSGYLKLRRGAKHFVF